MNHRILCIILTALALLSAAMQSSASSGGGEVAAPAGLGSVSSLDVVVDGSTIHLLAGENTADGKSAVFRYTQSSDGGRTWRPPVRVDQGEPRPVSHHRGSDAALIARGKDLFAAWTTPGTGFKGTGPMGTAISSDGGATWVQGPNPADDGSNGSHRFLALAAAGDTLHLVWLDDREKLRGLRHASSTDGGRTWSKNTTVDEYTCACCWNRLMFVPSVGPALAATELETATDRPAVAQRPAQPALPGKLYAFYRDMKPSDMGLAVSSDGGRNWKKLGHVGAFLWYFNGCPHVGGDLVALPATAAAPASPAQKGEGQSSAEQPIPLRVGLEEPRPALVAFVWTAQTGLAGCHTLHSTDGGVTWSQPKRLGSERGRDPALAVAAGSPSVVAAAWDDYMDDDKVVLAAHSTDGGATWTQPRRLSAAGKMATHPRVVANPNGGFFVLWTQTVGDGASDLAAAAYQP
jgi:hypothetical protein